MYLFSFQQHSRFTSVTTFVFYDIPGLRPPLDNLSFVFNSIPTSFPQKKEFLFKIGGLF
jgi:hypothetical protein